MFINVENVAETLYCFTLFLSSYASRYFHNTFMRLLVVLHLLICCMEGLVCERYSQHVQGHILKFCMQFCASYHWIRPSSGLACHQRPPCQAIRAVRQWANVINISFASLSLLSFSLTIEQFIDLPTIASQTKLWNDTNLGFCHQYHSHNSWKILRACCAQSDKYLFINTECIYTYIHTHIQCLLTYTLWFAIMRNTLVVLCPSNQLP